MSTNFLSLRSTVTYIASGVQPSTGTVYTVGSNGNPTWTSTLSGHIHISSLIGSTMIGHSTTLNLLNVNSSITTSTLTTGSLGLSTLTGSTVTASGITTSALSLSTLTGSTVTASGVTTTNMTNNFLVVNSTVTTSTLSVSNIDVSFLRGSSMHMVKNGNKYIELGTDAANTTYIDFHSQDSAIVDYDTRIASYGGNTSTINQGRIEFFGNKFGFTGGNLGIGSTDPVTTLDVNGYISLGNRLQGTVDGSNMFWTSLRGTATEVDRVAIGINGNPTTGLVNSLSFNTNSANRMFIASTGNVGIGTNAPEPALHIYRSSTNPIIGLQNGANAIFGIQCVDNSRMRLGTWAGSNTLNDHLVITSAGNVGIGTTNPQNILHVVNPTNSTTSICISKPNTAWNEYQTANIYCPDTTISGFDVVGLYNNGVSMYIQSGPLYHNTWRGNNQSGSIVIRAREIRSRGNSGNAADGYEIGGDILIDSGPVVRRTDQGNGPTTRGGDIHLRTGNTYNLSSAAAVDSQTVDWTTRLFVSGTTGTIGIGTVNPNAYTPLTIYRNLLLTPQEFTIGGSRGTYYRIRIDTLSLEVNNKFTITRGSVHTDGSWLGSMNLDVEFRANNCGHSSEFLTWKYRQFSNNSGSLGFHKFVARVINDDEGCAPAGCYVYLNGNFTYRFSGIGCYLAAGNTSGTGATLATPDEPFNTAGFYANCSYDSRHAGITTLSNNMGLGTSTPSALLHVNGSLITQHGYHSPQGLYTSPATQTVYFQIGHLIGHLEHWLSTEVNGIIGATTITWNASTWNGLNNENVPITITGNSSTLFRNSVQGVYVINTTGAAQQNIAQVWIKVEFSGNGTFLRHSFRSGDIFDHSSSSNGTLITSSSIPTAAASFPPTGYTIQQSYPMSSSNGQSLLGLMGQNVGIGTASPSKKLDIHLTETSAWPTGIRILQPGATSGYGPSFVFGRNDACYNLAALGFTYIGDGSQANYISMGVACDVTTPFQITGYGRVGIGITNPSYKLHVIGDIYATANVIAMSDQRVKKDIQPVVGALDRLSTLNGYTYLRDEQEDKRQMGLIAQEVQTVFPEAVHYDKEQDRYGVNYNAMIAPLLEAIKELKAKVDELSKRVVV